MEGEYKGIDIGTTNYLAKVAIIGRKAKEKTQKTGTALVRLSPLSPSFYNYPKSLYLFTFLPFYLFTFFSRVNRETHSLLPPFKASPFGGAGEGSSTLPQSLVPVSSERQRSSAGRWSAHHSPSWHESLPFPHRQAISASAHTC